MGRKCSHCGHNGHNSRTCIGPEGLVRGGGLRLFGVQLQIASPMKKSFSMECLSYACPASSSSSPTSSSSSSLVAIEETTEKISHGYLSDGLVGRIPERKKGIPWTEEEHKQFLAGLVKLGKGDWRGISRNFVTTRTPTQVASHAQKYFLRQNSISKKKRRSSLFDVVPNSESAAHMMDSSKLKEHCFSAELIAPILSLSSAGHEISETAVIDLNSSEQAQEPKLPSCLSLLPNASLSSSSQSSSLVERPHGIPLSPLDLELSISSSGSIDQDKASPSTLFLGTIKVT